MAGTERDLRANRPFLLAHPRLLERFPEEVGTGIDGLVAVLADVLRNAGVPEPEVSARLAYHMVFGILVDRAALSLPVDAGTVAAACTHARRGAIG